MSGAASTADLENLGWEGFLAIPIDRAGARRQARGRNSLPPTAILGKRHHYKGFRVMYLSLLEGKVVFKCVCYQIC